MSTLSPAFLTGAVFIASFVLTGWVRRHALRHLILDVPNSRSSHTVATPRGGGVAIVVAMLLTLLALAWMGPLPWSTVASLCPGGTLVALIGVLDDRDHVAPRWRLVGHFVAALSALAFMGGVPTVRAIGISSGSGFISIAILAVYLVWMLNLTNFMDGIDALAGVETITVCLSAIVLGRIAAPFADLWIAPLVLAAATLGFLVWNWPPARIFMGDAGSGFLGFTFGVFSLQAAWVSNRLFWSWLIILGVFVVDATVTLIRRVAHGEKFFEAHRSHAYQKAALYRGAHLPVAMAAGVVNVCWLLPIAVLVALGRLDGLIGVLIAYSPLVVIALRLKAGESSSV